MPGFKATRAPLLGTLVPECVHVVFAQGGATARRLDGILKISADSVELYDRTPSQGGVLLCQSKWTPTEHYRFRQLQLWTNLKWNYRVMYIPQNAAEEVPAMPSSKRQKVLGQLLHNRALPTKRGGDGAASTASSQGFQDGASTVSLFAPTEVKGDWSQTSHPGGGAPGSIAGSTYSRSPTNHPGYAPSSAASSTYSRSPTNLPGYAPSSPAGSSNSWLPTGHPEHEVQSDQFVVASVVLIGKGKVASPAHPSRVALAAGMLASSSSSVAPLSASLSSPSPPSPYTRSLFKGTIVKLGSRRTQPGAAKGSGGCGKGDKSADPNAWTFAIAAAEAGSVFCLRGNKVVGTRTRSLQQDRDDEQSSKIHQGISIAGFLEANNDSARMRALRWWVEDESSAELAAQSIW